MLTLTTTGLDEISIKLQNLVDGLADFTPAFEDLEGPLVQEFQANIASEGELLGGWIPLAESTELAREKRWGYYKQDPVGGGGMLSWTGTMGSGFVGESDQNSITITNAVDYATYQHFGNTRGTPARAIVGSTDTILQIVSQRITAYIKSFF